MNETVVIDTEIAKKDIGALGNAQLRYFFGNRPLIIVSAFFVIFVLYMTGFRFSMETLHYLPLPIASLLLIFLIFFTAIFRGSRQSYRKNMMYLTRTHFEFSDESILVTSKYGSSIIMWNEIDSINEVNPAFILTCSAKCEYVIARRSFTSQSHMDNFLMLITSKAEAGRIHLKHYGLEKAGTSSNADEPILQPAEQAAGIEVKVSLNRKETMLFELGRYYTQSVFGVLITLTGLMLLFIFTGNLITHVNSTGSNLLFLALGCFFISIIPVSIWLRVNNNRKRNGSQQEEHVYYFDENFVRIDCEDKMREYRWNELSRFTEHRKGFRFSVRLAGDHPGRPGAIPVKYYYVPKNAFANQHDADQVSTFAGSSRK